MRGIGERAPEVAQGYRRDKGKQWEDVGDEAGQRG